jgi:alkanesulfonate monooxygenase SsuD/methylene tetrahydromethanopterin reductase-like flavin-dependent oxidoreductase (luciferase family)
MQIGIDSFGAIISDPATGVTLSPVQRVDKLLEEIVLADQIGLDVFGIGEHHRSEFVESAPAVILAAAAMRTKSIRLTSAVTVLSAADPVRVFQEFATVDLLSHGRAEIVAGRGSSIEAFPLFGLRWTITTRSSQKSWIYSSRFAKTSRFIGVAGIARLSPGRRSIRALCRIRCRSGSESAERRSHSSAPARSDCH